MTFNYITYAHTHVRSYDKKEIIMPTKLTQVGEFCQVQCLAAKVSQYLAEQYNALKDQVPACDPLNLVPTEGDCKTETSKVSYLKIIFHELRHLKA